MTEDKDGKQSEHPGDDLYSSMVPKSTIDPLQQRLTSFTEESSSIDTSSLPSESHRNELNGTEARLHARSSTSQSMHPEANRNFHGKSVSKNLQESTQAPEPSFAQLAIRTFETYINETRADQIVPPLQEMICGYGEGLARLAQSTHHHLQLPQLQLKNENPPPQHQGEFLEPIALRRHIHSTPLIRRSPVSTLSGIHIENECDSNTDEDEPPPAGLEILDFTRSRSTPLTTSENSAFGTILRTNSHRRYDGSSTSHSVAMRGSAFSLPPYAMTKATSRSRSNERTARPVIFNPIIDEDEILTQVDTDDTLGEMTAIEVTNVPRPKEPNRPMRRKSAASRAAKFLTDVRNLRISSSNGGKRPSRYRPRDGRENPAQPSSVSSDEQSQSSPKEASNAGSSCRNKTEDRVTTMHSSDSPVGPTNDANSMQQAEVTSSDDRVCIQVNENRNFVPPKPYSASSPEPSTQSYPSTIHDSPDSSKCSHSLSNSSGRVSHSTSTSNSSNARSYGSRLSSISETDREVANLNHHQRIRGVSEHIDLSLSSDRTIRSGDLNCSLSATTPDSQIRRDGATVRADRFFNMKKDANRFRNLPPFMKRYTSTQSPTSGSCAASVTTNSSTGSDEPPQIVSYIDRKQVSDLSSLRQYPLESSSPRADHDHEVREASPSEEIQAKHSEVVFAGAHVTTIDVCNVPRPHWPIKGSHAAFGRKNRSLPPRSPVNKLFSSTTPPPQGGSSAYTISPPRQIIGHRPDAVSTDLSTPYVIGPVSSHFPSTELVHAPNQGSQVVRLSPNCDYYNLKPAARGLSPVYGHQVGRTYEESSIEILKTDSKDDSSPPLVTPDKGTSSP